MANMTSEKGSQLGDYLVGERLAAGGMAEIFHARCMTPGRFDRPIVLKRMHKHLAEDRDFVSMFIDEARISTRLDHANIVQLFDFQANSDGLYIVLEYINGPDLLSLLKGAARRRSKMPPAIAAYITCHILEALDYAHSLEENGRPLGIVHRDVSPGNVLISERGQVKLADFGIARANDRQQGSGAGTLKGKYGYMSPEQVEAKALDGRSDIFSAAIVLAELLMSKRLFSAPNTLDVLLMVRSGDLSRLDKHGAHIPVALLDILKNALARDRDARYSTASEFGDALVQWLATLKERMSTTILRRYVADLSSSGFIHRVGHEDTSGSLPLCGTTTKALSKAARASASSGRDLFELGNPGASASLGNDSSGVTVITSRPEEFSEYEDITIETPLSTEEALKTGHGEFGALLPIDLIGAIGARKLSGLLTLERDDIDKQAYFEKGHPVFVASNDPNESFGQFLILKEIITEHELHRANATLQHFNGKLGQALVALKLLRPVDAVHLLTEQVSEKLLRCCSWDYGRFVWQEGKKSPEEGETLYLSSARIVARGVRIMPNQHLSTWIEQRRGMNPNLAERAPYDEYGFGPSLGKRLRTMDGGRTIGDLVDSVSTRSLQTISAAVYALMITQTSE